jgi:membrane-bound lytic murein transglycosylase C
MKTKSSFVIIFIVFSMAYGQDDYEKWLKDQQSAFNTLVEEENTYMESITKEFDDYQTEQERLYQNFKDEVEKKWDEFKFSSKKTYVDYDGDLNARGSIDFENGEIEVEVIVDADPKQTSSEEKEAGEELLKKKLTQMVKKEADDKKPLLKDQLKNKQGQKVNVKNADSFAKETVKEQKVTKEKFTAKDGKERIKYTVKVKMQPDHVKTRAERFKKEVLTQSKRFKIDPAIAMAIMQTESSFNPKARSPIPAFGLMQLVPKSGARDAYNHVYKQDKLVSGKYLYVPSNNIELGCAYISKIRYAYFKNIRNDKSAYYCTISAYNTGPGNVAKAITGTTKLRPTTQKVNTMEPDQVYNTLKADLPYEETRNYLEKVIKRIEYYRSWI